ncbi:MAG: class I SAM-dependent methyltransferase [Bacteroidales bacterium]|nr:class I SAM-dependent methyltransferase [Bacteroidales bacterium]
MNKLSKRLNPNTKQFWENIYSEHIDQKKIRSDGDHLLRFIPIFEKAESVLDFGGGLGGNLKYLSGKLKNTRFILVDHSEVSLEFARTELLGEKDKQGNRFEYYTTLEKIPDNSIPMVISIQVLEHITEYKMYLDQLWAKTAPGGTMMISVPVKGIRDRNRQHVNKFTIKSMFKILTSYGEIVHIAPRTYSKRSGILSTAYFYVEKP